jgi:undecaprenyl-diphosphatase
LNGRGQEIDPLVASAAPGSWRAWAAFLLGSARNRLVRVSAVLLLGLGVATFWLLVDLAADVASGETQQADLDVTRWAQQLDSPLLMASAPILSAFGSELLVVLVLATTVVLARQQRWGAITTVLIVTLGAVGLNSLLKLAFQRARPEAVSVAVLAQGYSFPSGHAMVAAAFYTLLAYLGWRLLRGWPRRAYVGGLALLVLLIGWSRVYLGVHYLSDVVAGFLAGFLWAEAAIVGAHLLGRQRGTPREPARSAPD